MRVSERSCASRDSIAAFLSCYGTHLHFLAVSALSLFGSPAFSSRQNSFSMSKFWPRFIVLSSSTLSEALGQSAPQANFDCSIRPSSLQKNPDLTEIVSSCKGVQSSRQRASREMTMAQRAPVSALLALKQKRSDFRAVKGFLKELSYELLRKGLSAFQSKSSKKLDRLSSSAPTRKLVTF